MWERNCATAYENGLEKILLNERTMDVDFKNCLRNMGTIKRELQHLRVMLHWKIMAKWDEKRAVGGWVWLISHSTNAKKSVLEWKLNQSFSFNSRNPQTKKLLLMCSVSDWKSISKTERRSKFTTCELFPTFVGKTFHSFLSFTLMEKSATGEAQKCENFKEKKLVWHLEIFMNILESKGWIMTF